MELLAPQMAICRLEPEAPLPAWLPHGSPWSVTRTERELSIVCSQEAVPAEVQCERGWRCLRVLGPLDFEEKGILAGLAVPLASAGIPIFVVSTFDTDLLLVKTRDLAAAITTLREAGHRVDRGAEVGGE